MSKNKRLKGEKEKDRKNKRCSKCGHKNCHCDSFPNQKVKVVIDGPIGMTGNPGAGPTGATGETGATGGSESGLSE
ncbi:hypothetical protein [Peribacillus sp. NPDC097295]|uniref:hypothetical protein n=1 Tax=Peribacillus sp. NPDC097295 TaxID=3364402 RepID=UPI00381013F0